jgi:hypothetical protein
MHIQPFPMFPDPDKNILDYILTCILIPQNQKSKLVQAFPMPAVKDVEGILITISYSTNKFLICRKMTQSS